MQPSPHQSLTSKNSTSAHSSDGNGRLRPTGRGTSIYETRADCKKRVTLSAELDGVFRIDVIQSSLGNPIRYPSNVPSLLDKLGITSSAGDVDNFPLGTFFDQRKESICDGDRPKNIGPELFLGSERKFGPGTGSTIRSW